MKKTRNSGFTMLELIIAVAVMSVAGLLVARLFVTASNLERKAQDTDRAVCMAQSMIEEIKSAGGASPGDSAQYYDESWNEGGAACYRVSRSVTDLGGGLSEIEVAVVRVVPYPTEGGGETELCRLKTKEYGGGGDAQ